MRDLRPLAGLEIPRNDLNGLIASAVRTEVGVGYAMAARAETKAGTPGGYTICVGKLNNGIATGRTNPPYPTAVGADHVDSLLIRRH